MREHIRLFNETWGKTKNFAVLKKFFKIYVQGFPHASEIRVRLMETNNRQEAEMILREITV
jgi:tRNA-dihydrouridine synthase